MLPQLIINGIIAGSIYALVAFGFTIIFQTVKIFHLAHGGIYTAGAYFAFILINYLHLHLIPTFLITLIFGAILGIAIEKIVYLPLRQKRAANLIFLIASFGVLMFIQNFIFLLFGDEVMSIRTGAIREGHKILNVRITSMQIVIVIASLLFMALTWLFIRKTKIGYAIQAVADNTDAAKIVGIETDHIIMVVMGLGSALGSASSILISFQTDMVPTMGLAAILKGIIASIIGGVGSLFGALLGGFFIGIVENIGIWGIASDWKDLISFLIFIIFLLFLPRGLFGSKVK